MSDRSIYFTAERMRPILNWLRMNDELFGMKKVSRSFAHDRLKAWMKPAGMKPPNRVQFQRICKYAECAGFTIKWRRQRPRRDRFNQLTFEFPD